MWKAGNVINRIGGNPPAVLIFDPETDSDIGEARTMEAARLMAAAPAMLAALQSALTYIGDDATDDSAEAKAARADIAAAIALATGVPSRVPSGER